MTDTPNSPLVSTEWLASQSGNTNVRVFDTTVHLLRGDDETPYRIESGRSDYQAAHIPGAAFVDLQGDLSRTDTSLRFTLPEAQDLQNGLSALGMGREHLIVLYSTTSTMWATRIWWMLHSAGYDNIFVLDGGLIQWRAEGRPVSAGDERYPPASAQVELDLARWATKAEVEQSIADDGVCVMNALSTAMYRGDGDFHYGRRGHIANSVSVPYDGLVTADGRFTDMATARAALNADALAPEQSVICYCGGGIAATMNAFALHRLGFSNVSVYDGSMSEWVADPDAPMVIGANPV